MLEAHKVLAAANAIADVDDRVAFVEDHFALVDRPAELVETWIDACHSNETLAQDEIVTRARALAATHAASPGFLSELGKQLDYFDYPEACIAILQEAVVRDDENDQAYEALGRQLLVRRGDPRGLALVERARALDPDWDKPRVTLAAHFLTRDPAHALALLGDSGETYACELRSMLLAASGYDEGAVIELDEALSHYPTRIEAHLHLCMWHYDERRFARSREHASALRALLQDDVDNHERERAEAAIVSAYRMGGNFAELVPWLQERCKGRGSRGSRRGHLPRPHLAVSDARLLARATCCRDRDRERSGRRRGRALARGDGRAARARTRRLHVPRRARRYTR